MGKTISITIPKPLERELKEEAEKQGVSRSRFIGNILMAWSEEMKQQRLKAAYRNTMSTPEAEG